MRKYLKNSELWLNHSRSVYITLSYLVVGVLWIYFSDLALEKILSNEELLTTFQTFKGWFFIFFTAALIYGISKKLIRKLEEDNKILVETNERLEFMLEGVDEGVFEWPNMMNDEVWCSDKFFLLIGYSPGEIEPSQSAFEEMIHPDDLEKARGAFESAILQRDTKMKTEYRMRLKNGKYEWFVSRGFFTYDENGLPIKMGGTLKRIHDILDYESQIEFLEKRFTNLFEQTPLSLLFLDRSGTILASNSNANHLLNINNNVDRTLKIGDVLNIEDNLSDLFIRNGKMSVDVKTSITLSEAFLMYWSSFRFHGMDYTTLWIENRFEQQKLLNKLNILNGNYYRNFNVLKSLFELIPEFAWVYNIVDKKYLYTNNHLSGDLEVVSIEIDNPNGYFIDNLIHPDDYAGYLNSIMINDKNIRREGVVRNSIRIRNHSNQWVFVVCSENVLYEGGKPVQIVGVLEVDESLKHQENEILQLKKKIVDLLQINEAQKTVDVTRFNEIFVAREFRIKEMKEQIIQLENLIGKSKI